ncbi:MAG: hypothetical protein PHE59_02120 [Patescibacteria group bacterium]|nr:hypothetical protein [Patescibacteria group bacterium]MDD5534578.1 hypothetical protein [Patescibacteria group bacterium]
MFTFLMMLVAAPLNLNMQCGLTGGPDFLGGKIVLTNGPWGCQYTLSGLPQPANHSKILWQNRWEAVYLINSGTDKNISYLFGGIGKSNIDGGPTGVFASFGGGSDICAHLKFEVGLGHRLAGDTPGSKLVNPYNTYENSPWIILGGFFAYF